ncbi:MAG: putative Ig domain-containing protein, partial [Dehalococcoidia bacterium]|nr:putative Ig domain-containing protein [Dehalococcoidia bacterium]
MKRIRWVAIPILFILACSMLPLAFTGPVQADEGKSNLAELTAGADSVIVGTVVERSSYWNDERTGIYTSVVLSIEEGLKGTVCQDRITVTLPGGEADGIEQWVSDVPSFDQGEKAVVFLKKIPPEKLPKTKAHKAQPPEEQFEVYHGYQGKFAIKQGKVDNLPEPEFKERVRKVAQGQTLPEAELYVPSSTATFPYSYAGFCWPHPPAPVVSYRINENTADCGGEGATVQTAAATWNAPANFSFSYAGASAATAYSYNGVNDALWKDFGSGGTIAHAIIWYSGSTILENDIEFNDYYVWSTAASCPGGQFDVETIALHELGHWLCLNDLYNAADAAKVMYGYGSTGTTKRALHADDIAGIQFIYGVSALNITTTSLPDGTMGSPSSQTLQATGGTGSYTWSITGGSLPAGLTLTPSSGLISGTPTASGPSSFTVQVNDGSTTATKSLSINISSPTLTITTSSLPAGVVDTPYSQQLQASGGSGTYTWSIISGSLPAGLTLTPSSGLISGTPTIAATSNFTVQVNDGSTTTSKPLSITINPADTTQKLVGTDTSGTETVSPNYIQLSKFTAAATGTVSQIKVYSTASA